MLEVLNNILTRRLNIPPINLKRLKANKKSVLKIKQYIMKRLNKFKHKMKPIMLWITSNEIKFDSF